MGRAGDGVTRGWFDEVYGWLGPPPAVAPDARVAMVELGRRFGKLLAAQQISRGEPGPAVQWVAETADPLADELALLEQLRRAYEVPTVLVPIENSRGQRTGEAVEMPADELGAWLRQRRRDRLRPGLVAEIERRCWEATRR